MTIPEFYKFYLAMPEEQRDQILIRHSRQGFISYRQFFQTLFHGKLEDRRKFENKLKKL